LVGRGRGPSTYRYEWGSTKIAARVGGALRQIQRWFLGRLDFDRALEGIAEKLPTVLTARKHVPYAETVRTFLPVRAPDQRKSATALRRSAMKRAQRRPNHGRARSFGFTIRNRRSTSKMLVA
jgi:hypothetical protein